jgi:hypothetical protein
MINKEPIFSLENADLNTLLMPSWVKESSQIPRSYQDKESPKKYGDEKSKYIPRDRRNDGRKNRSFATKKEVVSTQPSPLNYFMAGKSNFFQSNAVLMK